ncbi:MAG: hypothetical protein MK135_07580, partial [Polyangiaceae bacterium]|nr:hypothetical protein [Polyangiaceae bacterium]
MQSAIEVNACWSFVYVTLAAYFGITAYKFRLRQFWLFGIVLLFLSLTAAAEAMVGRLGPGMPGFLVAQLVLLASTWAPAVHTHFIFLGFEVRFLRPWVRGGYTLAAAATIAQFSLVGREVYLSYVDLESSATIAPSKLVNQFIGGLLVAHLVLGVLGYIAASRQQNKTATYSLVALSLCVPFIIFDYVHVFSDGAHLILSAAMIWIYGLVQVAGLLAELRREGQMLVKTTSTLVETTAELE